MCRTCWKEHGSPEIVNDRVLRAARLVHVIYEDNQVGMPLHVQLDDWNLDSWEPWPDQKTVVSAEAWAAAEELCQLAPTMPIAERASFLALASGYFEYDEGS